MLDLRLERGPRSLALAGEIQRLTECDPCAGAAKPQPIPMRVELVAADERARNHRRISELRQAGETRLERRALEHRARAVADATLGKNSDDAPALEPRDHLANRGAIDFLFAIDWKRVHRVHPQRARRRNFSRGWHPRRHA